MLCSFDAVLLQRGITLRTTQRGRITHGEKRDRKFIGKTVFNITDNVGGQCISHQDPEGHPLTGAAPRMIVIIKTSFVSDGIISPSAVAKGDMTE